VTACFGQKTQYAALLEKGSRWFDTISNADAVPAPVWWMVCVLAIHHPRTAVTPEWYVESESFGDAPSSALTGTGFALAQTMPQAKPSSSMDNRENPVKIG
jgi:hypothetical protein